MTKEIYRRLMFFVGTGSAHFGGNRPPPLVSSTYSTPGQFIPRWTCARSRDPFHLFFVFSDRGQIRRNHIALPTLHFETSTHHSTSQGLQHSNVPPFQIPPDQPATPQNWSITMRPITPILQRLHLRRSLRALLHWPLVSLLAHGAQLVCEQSKEKRLDAQEHEHSSESRNT